MTDGDVVGAAADELGAAVSLIDPVDAHKERRRLLQGERAQGERVQLRERLEPAPAATCTSTLELEPDGVAALPVGGRQVGRAGRLDHDRGELVLDEPFVVDVGARPLQRADGEPVLALDLVQIVVEAVVDRGL